MEVVIPLAMLVIGLIIGFLSLAMSSPKKAQ